nr:glycosyltransferase family 39 protein [Lapidilactobacillus luobeiensis]
MAQTAQQQTKPRTRPQRRCDWYLLGILGLALFLYAWKIWEAGNANDFYTAAITSMTKSWRNFWYASFDPAGFITVDKPPVALWFMAISAKIFGVHGWSVVLPSVLFGVGSVYLLDRLVRPRFGRLAGNLAALTMTLTPIVVADSRTNNMDATLIFFLLLALYFLQKATQAQRPWLVMLSFGLIGIAFNIKMLQAFMILPIMYLYYWLATKQTWRKKLGHLALATVSLTFFTLLWPLSVDLTSASERPYEGGSETNSVLELAFGYNGTQRLLGQTTGTGARFSGMGNSKEGGGMTPPSGNGTGGTTASGGTTAGNTTPGGTAPTGAPPTVDPGSNGTTGGGNGQGTTPPSGTAPSVRGGQTGGSSNGQTGTAPSGNPQNSTGTGGITGQNGPGGQQMTGGGPGGNGGAGGAFNIGTAGPFRIFQKALGQQVSWLLAVAMFGLLGAFAFYRRRKNRWYQTTARQNEVILWGGWLILTYGFFSVASFFHPYYMIMLAPAIAALVGIGLPAIWQQFWAKRRIWTLVLLPLALLVTSGLQAWYVYSDYPWLSWLILLAGVTAVALLFIGKYSHLKKKLVPSILVTSTIAMVVAPAWWSLTPTLSGESAAIPYASPSLLSSGARQAGGLGSESVNSSLLSYLQKNQGSATYLFATTDSGTAAPYIIATGEAVMVIGGFNGTDPAITLKRFKKLVKAGQIKYFYLAGKSSNNTIVQWVKKNAQKVAASKYGGTTSSSSTQSQTMFNQNNKTTGRSANTTGGGSTTTANGPQAGLGGMGGTSGTLYDLASIYD